MLPQHGSPRGRAASDLAHRSGTHPVARGIAIGGRFVTATGSGRVAFVDARDVTAVAVAALTDDAPHDTEHVLTGPRALSYDGVAALVSEAVGRTVHYEGVGAGELAERITGAGVSRAFAEQLAVMDEEIGRQSEDRTADTVQRITGRPPRTLRALLGEHHAAPTSSSDGTTATLAALTDRLAVQDALTRMSWLMDPRDWAALAEVFAEEVLVDYTQPFGGDAEVLTPDALVAGWRAQVEPMHSTQHVPTGILVDLDGDRAGVTADVLATQRRDSSSGAVLWQNGRTARVRMTRTRAGWRITTLNVALAWTAGNTEVLRIPAAAFAEPPRSGGSPSPVPAAQVDGGSACTVHAVAISSPLPTRRPGAPGEPPVGDDL